MQDVEINGGWNVSVVVHIEKREASNSIYINISI